MNVYEVKAGKTTFIVKAGDQREILSRIQDAINDAQPLSGYKEDFVLLTEMPAVLRVNYLHEEYK
jgi:hypothetical protein